MILRQTTTQILLNCQTKKARTQEKDECYDRTGPDELIQMAAKEMLDWKVVDIKGKNNPVPIYYVRELKKNSRLGQVLLSTIQKRLRKR